MSNSSYDVFLSYRRTGGSALAELVRSALVQRGFRVFMDVRELSAGPFDTSLKQSIEKAENFVILLTPGCLDRCGDPRDWLLQEITVALNAKRQIVPLKTEDFQFPPPQQLPKAAAILTRHHCVTYVHEHGEASLDKLCGLLHRGRRHIVWHRTAAALAVAALFIVAVGAGFFYFSAPGPKPSPHESVPISEGPQPINLLALIDINRDQKGGSWIGNESLLIGKGGERGFYLALPWEPPPEYRLHLRVTRLSTEKNTLYLGLATDEKRFSLSIDADGNNPYTGLTLLDGRKTKLRSDLRKGRVITRGVPIELVATVRKDSIQLESNGNLIYQWSGDLNRATRPLGQLTAPLVIGGRNGGFEFEKIMLEPLGDDPGKPVEDH